MDAIATTASAPPASSDPATRWPHTRWQAGAVHLAISIVIGALLFVLVRWVWYPGVLFRISGGAELALLVIGVDVVIGPLLTTVVFSRKKKRLWFDLSVIALLQLAAFGYGAYITLAARPVFLVGAIDRVQAVGLNEIAPENWAGAAPEAQVSWWGPRWVGVTVPLDQRLREGILFGEVGGGADMPFLPGLYQSLDSVKSELLVHARSPSTLSEASRSSIERVVGKENAAAARILPLVGRVGSAVLLLDEQGNPGRMIDADPWTAPAN